MNGDWTPARTMDWMTRVFQACTSGASLFDADVFARASEAIHEGIPHDRLTLITFDEPTRELRIAARIARNGDLPPPFHPDGALFRNPPDVAHPETASIVVFDSVEGGYPPIARHMERDGIGSCIMAALQPSGSSRSRAWLAFGWVKPGQASRVDRLRIEQTMRLLSVFIPPAHDHARALRFTAMLDRVPHSVLALDAACRVLEANKAARTLLGYGMAEALGEPFESVLTRDSAILFRSVLESNTKNASLVLVVQSPDGHIPVDVVLTRVVDDPAVAYQVHLQDARRRLADEAELESRADALAFLRELAEQVAGELNARRALERVAVLFTERLPVRGVAISRIDGNDGLLALVAEANVPPLALRELLAFRVRDDFGVPGDGTMKAPSALQKAIGEQHAVLLVPLRHADRLVGVALFWAPERIESATRELLLAGSRTIAVALHASIEFAEVVRLAAERRQLLDSIPSLVFRIEPVTGRTVYVNAAVVRVLGTPVDRALGSPGIEGLLADHTERDLMAQTRAVVAQGSESPWIDRRFLHRDGRTLVLRTRLYPVRVESGFDERSRGDLLIEGIAHDVTDEMEARKQLVQADRLASLGMLAAGVAHEINNPTAFISLGVQQLARMIVQLAEDPEASEPVLRRMSEIVSEVADGVQRIVQIVGELKLFARIPESAFSTPVDVNRLITSAVTLARSEIRSRARLEIDLGDLPPLPGDHARLGQVFVNLLINAAQAIEPGDEEHNRVTVRTRAFDGYVQIEVADTGVGIPRENLTRIFDPFFTTKAPGEGTGLGLAISADLIKRAGGTVDVESEIGRGTRFCVKLPVRNFVPPRGSRPQIGTVTPGGRILVVEDEHHLGVAVARALASNYMVELAPDATTALERISAGGGSEYDVVLCDLRMPGMDGKALFEAVQQRWPTQARRFIFLTGAGFGGEFESFIRSTDRPVVEKPFDMQELEDLVAEMVSAHARAD